MALKSISYRQIRALDLWIEGGLKSKAKALREAGYSEAVVRKPSKVFDSPAVLEELEKRGRNHRGLRLPPEAVIPHEPIPQKPHLDFSQVPKEVWQELKEKLDALPNKPARPVPPSQSFFEPKREGRWFVPTWEGNLFDGGLEQKPRYKSFSSM